MKVNSMHNSNIAHKKKLNSCHPRMLCAKFGRNCLSGPGENLKISSM